jgi:hypothetical protein
MRAKLAGSLVLVCLFVLAVPVTAQGQNRIRRDRNGIRYGDVGISLFDGPGILNYEHRHRWMPGPGGAVTVIGIGAGAGAATGGLIKGKKGAVIGALVGGGSATALWLYKNRRHKHRIF